PMSRHSPSSLESGVAGLSLGGSGGRPSSSSPFSNPRPAHSSSPSSNDDSAYETGGGGGATSLMRKADYAYNHLVLASRPGECRAFRRKMNVIANYFKIRTPDSLQAYAYRVEFKTKGRQGYETVTKKEKCEPLFWALYREQRRLFPASVYRIVFDGVGMIYSLDPIPLRGGEEDFTFSAEPPKPEPARAPQGNSNGGGYGGRGGYGGGGRGGGRPRAPAMAQAYITVVPMIKTDTFMVSDEVTRCALIQLLDLIITQEMRCPLLQDNSKFVTTGHSIFRVPDSDDDRHTAVRRIGMGEEVWTGLHMAVKPDCPDSLYLNASTSGSIFHTPKLNLVTFYAEIVNGYTLNQDIDTSRLTIVQWQLNKLADILKGTKVRIYRKAHDDWVAKKFDKFSQQPASALYFNCEGRDVSVAEYFHNSNLALKFPHLPCLAFYNKITRQQSYIPMELATTSEEPRKYKGRLSDLQLNAFIKAVGMVPREKKALISNFMAPGGKYVGEGALMDEWGVEVEREMVAIDDALILPYPDIKWKNSTTSVNAVSAEYAICDTDNGAPRPRQMIESPSKPLAVVMVFVNGDGCPEMLDRRMTPEELNHAQTRVYDTSYRTHAELICNTLRGYSIDTLGPAYTFQYLLNDRGEMHLPRLRGIIDHWKNEIAGIGRKNGKDYAPLFMFVFPRRHEKFYAAIKYTCDVDKGVLSQCILKRTFEKMQGNALSNTSAQNVLLKIVAKAGGAVCRLDGNQFRNVGKITSVEEPTLVLGIDVSHPSREERMKALESGGILQGYAKQANQNRGRHERCPPPARRPPISSRTSPTTTVRAPSSLSSATWTSSRPNGASRRACSVSARKRRSTSPSPSGRASRSFIARLAPFRSTSSCIATACPTPSSRRSATRRRRH
ncbi:hypothetical protein PFISCL1PPCAC_4858, partial [Pristionchus fissidentatus]